MDKSEKNYIKYWSKNIKDGPKTSILGGLFIAGGIISVFIAVSSWVTAIIPIVFGTYLMCMEKKGS